MPPLSSTDYYTSPLSRFCHEQLPQDFHYLDGDEVLLRYSAQPVTYARETRVLRVIESKRPGESIRRSQREVLPIIATAIRFAVNQGRLGPGSGVFLIEGDEPYDEGALLYQILPEGDARAAGMGMLGPRRISRSEVAIFVRCRNLSRSAA